MAASVLPAAVIRQIQHNVLYGAVLALDLVICIDDQVDGILRHIPVRVSPFEYDKRLRSLPLGESAKAFVSHTSRSFLRFILRFIISIVQIPKRKEKIITIRIKHWL